jgi:hypothetical protein
MGTRDINLPYLWQWIWHEHMVSIMLTISSEEINIDDHIPFVQLLPADKIVPKHITVNSPLTYGQYSLDPANVLGEIGTRLHICAIYSCLFFFGQCIAYGYWHLAESSWVRKTIGDSQPETPN